MPESREGAGDAIRCIMECAPRIRAWLSLQLSDPHDVDDLAQETLVAAWKGWPGFRGDSSLSTWMHGIAKRLLWSHYRRSGGMPSHWLDMDFGRLEPVEPPALPLAGESDFGTAFGKLCLELMVERLPPEDARLYGMFYRDRLTVREISRELRIPEGTVKYRLFAIRASLRARA